MTGDSGLSIALFGDSKAAADIHVTSVSVTGGTHRHVRSDDGALELDLRLPPTLGGEGGAGGAPYPEQLFAASYAGCFHGTLTLLAERAGVPADAIEVTVTVTFRRDPVDGLFMLAAAVRIRMPGVAKPAAEELIRNAERVCPYTKMAQQGIDCIVTLVGADP